MESSYKIELRKARQSVDETLHPLLNTSWSYKKEIPCELTVVKEDGSSEESVLDRSVSEVIDVTKKVQNLDSQNVFEGKTPVIALAVNSKIHEDKNNHFGRSLKFNCLTFLALEKLYESINLELLKEKFPIDSAPLDIVFVTDKSEGVETSIFHFYFKEDVAELFLKMTKAMNLEPNKFSITSLKLFTQATNIDENDRAEKDRLYSEVYHLKPKLIMTLGAQAYQAFIGHEMRLKDVHGQLQDITLESDSGVFPTKIMPIFSPNLLQTAPNMKKTAWADLQKAMEYLN